MMIHNSNDVIAPTAQAAMPAITRCVIPRRLHQSPKMS